MLQEIRAELVVTEDELTEEITGAVVSGGGIIVTVTWLEVEPELFAAARV